MDETSVDKTTKRSTENLEFFLFVAPALKMSKLSNPV